MILYDTSEGARLARIQQKKGNCNRWGPFLSERASETVRMDYSADGHALRYFAYDDAHSRLLRLVPHSWRDCQLPGADLSEGSVGPVYGVAEKFQTVPDWREYILFHESQYPVAMTGQASGPATRPDGPAWRKAGPAFSVCSTGSNFLMPAEQAALRSETQRGNYNV